MRTARIIKNLYKHTKIGRLNFAMEGLMTMSAVDSEHASVSPPLPHPLHDPAEICLDFPALVQNLLAQYVSEPASMGNIRDAISGISNDAAKAYESTFLKQVEMIERKMTQICIEQTGRPEPAEITLRNSQNPGKEMDVNLMEAGDGLGSGLLRQATWTRHVQENREKVVQLRFEHEHGNFGGFHAPAVSELSAPAASESGLKFPVEVRPNINSYTTKCELTPSSPWHVQPEPLDIESAFSGLEAVEKEEADIKKKDSGMDLIDTGTPSSDEKVCLPFSKFFINA